MRDLLWRSCAWWRRYFLHYSPSMAALSRQARVWRNIVQNWKKYRTGLREIQCRWNPGVCCRNSELLVLFWTFQGRSRLFWTLVQRGGKVPAVALDWRPPKKRAEMKTWKMKTWRTDENDDDIILEKCPETVKWWYTSKQWTGWIVNLTSVCQWL